MVPRIHPFAASTFGAKSRPLVFSNTQNASARRSALGGCLASPSRSLYLYDSTVGSDYPYEVPTSAPAFLSGSTTGLADAPLAALITGSGSNSTFGIIPSTNGMTAHGLPAEKATALGNLAQNDGPDDGVSHTSTSQPTSVLVTLAAAGRNPTDITIPTQAGTEGSGGDDEEDDAAGSGTFEAMGDSGAGGGGSHLLPLWEGVKSFGGSLWNGAVTAATAIKDTGEGLYAVATSSEAREAFATTWQETRVQPMADRLFQKAELRGTTEEIADQNNTKLALYVIEDMVGAQLAEAWYGYDLTAKKLEGELFDGGERTQTLLFGVAGATGAGAAMLSPISEATGLTFRLGSLRNAASTEAGALSNTARVSANAAAGEGGAITTADETANLEAANARLRILQGACFAAGTPLLAPHGARLIEDIRAGDLVLSRPEDDPTGPIVAKRVLRTVQTYSPLLDLHSGGQVIRTTAKHPIWVIGRGWTAAERIEPGDAVLGAGARATPVRMVEGPTAPAAVHNLEVEEYHTYLVGTPHWGFAVWRITVEKIASNSQLSSEIAI